MFINWLAHLSRTVGSHCFPVEYCLLGVWGCILEWMKGVHSSRDRRVLPKLSSLEFSSRSGAYLLSLCKSVYSNHFAVPFWIFSTHLCLSRHHLPTNFQITLTNFTRQVLFLSRWPNGYIEQAFYLSHSVESRQILHDNWCPIVQIH